MNEELWKARFTAPRIDDIAWSNAVPERLGAITTESGSSQAWAWDLASGTRREVSTDGVGAEEVHVMADGSGVVWWLDPLGDERGRWMVTPFDGGEATALLPGLDDAWMSGISLVDGAVAAGFATEDRYEVVVLHDDGTPKVVYRHERAAGVGQEWPQGPGGLSSDASLLAIRHAEASDISNQALRVVDARTGEAIAELLDDGRPVLPAGWSPVRGDQRLVVIREVGDAAQPWMWDPVAGSSIEIDTGLPGIVTLAAWYPDASALLLHHDHEAVHSLHRFDLATTTAAPVGAPGGTISGTRIRPDGQVWLRRESGERAPAWFDPDDVRVLSLPTESAPRGRAWEATWFDNPNGDRIQGWLMRPDGPPPYPTVVSVHGGPEYHNTDAFEPRRQAFADAGFAVLMVNYRGSTGYGAHFRKALDGNIGFPESEDINAGLDHLIASGITDPSRVVLEGWSWGGYLATLNAGLHPERWSCVIAGIPVGDSVAAHYESAPALRDWDIAIMGGSPMDVPELFRERNPITYVDRVRAPMLMIVGEHDSRCPLGQVMVYAHALRVRGGQVDVHLYAGGHHANDVDEQIAQVELMLDFMRRHTASD